jgi:hypothetical protein
MTEQFGGKKIPLQAVAADALNHRMLKLAILRPNFTKIQ